MDQHACHSAPLALNQVEANHGSNCSHFLIVGLTTLGRSLLYTMRNVDEVGVCCQVA